jgi:DNA-binding transcriptional LysR family regulator
MDWNDLRYVIAIADKGSLKSASDELGVNHSTVWRRVKILEKHLGCQIFIVDRQGYRLTVVGEEVLNNARKIASSVESIKLSTSINKKDMQGLIRITAPNTIASEKLPEIIYRFKTKYPLIQFEIIQEVRNLNIGKLEADIAIRSNAKAPDNLIARKLQPAPWAIFAHQDLVPKGGVKINELKNQPLIGYTGFDIKAVKWFRSHVSDGPYHINCNNVATAFGCARNKLGFALLPVLMSTDLVEVHRLPEFDEYIWLLAHPEMRNVIRVKVFWDFLLEQNEEGLIF